MIHTFTNQQGTDITDGVLQVISANLNSHSDSGFNWNASDGTTSENNNSNRYINYTMGYWMSQADKDAGLAPYTYQIVENGSLSGNIHADVGNLAGYETLTAEEAALKHFTEVLTA